MGISTAEKARRVLQNKRRRDSEWRRQHGWQPTGTPARARELVEARQRAGAAEVGRCLVKTK